jgi:hypothetical protein
MEWNEIKLLLPSEKPNDTIGRPIIPFRKVLDGILHVLGQGVNGRCCQKNMVLALLPAIGDFNNG